jgi:hypothetical protein
MHAAVLTCALAFAAADPAPPTDPASPTTTPPPVSDDGKQRSKLDEILDDLFAGTWLDPKDPYWNPRRGERFELSVLVGGEGAFSAVAAANKLPSIGGTVLNGLVRYYPVDRLAVVAGGRTYVGLDGVPAAGTTASSVVSAIVGVRYDLVRENRFSLLWDLYSGPSLYVFAPLTRITSAETAVGGEMGTALAMRYSIGPFTGEARGLVGGRAGATDHPFQRAGDSGPFQALYAGFDVGGTWSIQ